MVKAEKPPDRGMSELIGMVLLIGIVLVGAVTVVVIGAGAISRAEGETRLKAAEGQLSTVESRLATLARGDETTQVSLDFSESVAEDYSINRSGWLNVTVERNGTCSVQHNLTSVVYEGPNGRSVAYQAGGVFTGDRAGSYAISPPAVSYDRRRIGVRLVNLTGRLNQIRNVIVLNVSRTAQRSNETAEALFQGTCSRPDNVTIRVHSRYQTAWKSYLREEFPTEELKTLADGTVLARVEALHPAANDSRNHVIDLRQGSLEPYTYMQNVVLNGNPSPPDEGPVVVNAEKGVPSNNYSASIQPLTESRLDIGRRIEIGGTNVTGPPKDIVFTLDTSPSMAEPATSPEFATKLEAVQSAAKNFVGGLNLSRHRVGLVEYNDQDKALLSNKEYFSQNGTALNQTIDGLTDSGVSTWINTGVNGSHGLFDFKSNASREKVNVLLTDGINQGCYDNDGVTYDCMANNQTLAGANLSGRDGITIYTIGYGSDVQEELLKDVANATGGEYYDAADGDEVENAFESIRNSLEPTSAIARPPLTSTVTSSGGGVFTADIPGDTSHIANVTSGGITHLNLNDPTAPSPFSISFPHPDPESFELNMSSYECADGGWNSTGETRTVDGETLAVLRCGEVGSREKSYGGEITLSGERPERLLSTTYADWQTDVNTTLRAFRGVTINDTTGHFEARSNQALVTIDLPPEGSGTRNSLGLLVNIGLSAEDDARDVLSVRIAEAAVQN